MSDPALAFLHSRSLFP
uniref:Uncharacterized protein n=1 Tax=Arundo donax TaxID=35708 RepID=A0A0A8ZJ60_ARUDO